MSECTSVVGGSEPTRCRVSCKLRAMRYLLLLLPLLLLPACDNKKAKEFAHSPGVKQLARVGAAVLSKPVNPPADNVPVSSGAIAPVPLVKGKAVGHRDFEHAKQVLPRIYAGGMQQDFYCGCQYSGKNVDWGSCGYVPRKNAKRAERIEWEHVFPAEHFGSQRSCWQHGGRKNCSGKDALFDAMEGDLNNLVPAVGEVNGDRSNYSYSVWTSNPVPVYGQCKSVPDFESKRFQPREEVRGSAARISLYMAGRYGLRISRQSQQLWCAWAKQYPVSNWEKVRDNKIRQLQGEGNPMVEDEKNVKKACA